MTTKAEYAAAKEAKANSKKAKKGAAPAPKHAPKGSRHRVHRSAFTRKCLTKTSKILFARYPRWFMVNLQRYEQAA